MTSSTTYFEHPDWTGTTRVQTDQQNRSRCVPEPYYSSRRDQQGAATLHKTQQGAVTPVLLYAGNVAGSMATLPFGDGTSLGINNANAEAETAHYAMLDKDFYGSSNSGTNHALFRQYMDTIGSWMSPDPDLGSYDASNPQSMNRYSYVLNNPLAYVDPDGTSQCQTGDTSCDCKTGDSSCSSSSDGSSSDGSSSSDQGQLAGFGEDAGEEGACVTWGGCTLTFYAESNLCVTSDCLYPPQNLANEYFLSTLLEDPLHPSENVLGGGSQIGLPSKSDGCSVHDKNCMHLRGAARYGAFLSCEGGVWVNDLGHHGVAVLGTAAVAINALRKMSAQAIFGDAVKVSNVEGVDALLVSGLGLLESIKSNETCSSVYGYGMW